jgi:hypothetical protein
VLEGAPDMVPAYTALLVPAPDDFTTVAWKPKFDSVEELPFVADILSVYVVPGT